MKSMFHHPDYCPRVIGRRVTEQLVDALASYGAMFFSGGRSLLKSSSAPSDTAYRMTLSRLRKAGLVVVEKDGGGMPGLALTEAGRASMSVLHRPEVEWDRPWSKVWNLLVYDIPEKDRSYRRVLRDFLRRMRLGCLQGSVWIAPRDIRAEFDDLTRGAALGGYAFLFEARTVLGLPTEAIVTESWDFDRLQRAQQWYLQHIGAATEGLAQPVEPSELRAWLNEELEAYLAVMHLDPLLPRTLWPDGYAGPAVVAAHRAFVKAAGRLL